MVPKTICFIIFFFIFFLTGVLRRHHYGARKPMSINVGRSLLKYGLDTHPATVGIVGIYFFNVFDVN